MKHWRIFSKVAAALTVLLMLSSAACDERAPAPHPTVQAAGPSGTVTGDPADGARLWREKQCLACHGPNALGGASGLLANTALSFDQFLSKVRNALPPKPAMTAADLSDSDAYSIYLWLHTLPPGLAKAAPATLAPLPAGQVLGIQLWTEKGCNECHGAFAQGSDKGPALAGEAYPFERQRAVMLADQIPAHSVDNIPDDILRRLLDWLRRGADPAGGC